MPLNGSYIDLARGHDIFDVDNEGGAKFEESGKFSAVQDYVIL